MPLWIAAILGLVEGLTEYLPVSSTGHLILASHLLGQHGDTSKAFDVVIQVGAIFAVVVHYRTLLAERIRGLFRGAPESIRLVLALAAAFVPTAVVGLLLRKTIKRVLFGPLPVAIALVVGGIVILLTTRVKWNDQVERLEDLTPRRAFFIGVAQCIALIPGASRSLCTILGGRILGLSTKVAAEFSFLLALPVLGAAAGLDLFKERHSLLTRDMAGPMVVGLLVSFVVAYAVIGGFLRYLERRSLAVFGVYRIVVGLGFAWVLLR